MRLKALRDLTSALHVVPRTEKKNIKASPFTVSLVIISLKSFFFKLYIIVLVLPNIKMNPQIP